MALLAVVAAACGGGGGDEDGAAIRSVEEAASGEAFCNAVEATNAANDASEDAVEPDDMEDAVRDLKSAVDDLADTAPSEISEETDLVSDFTNDLLKQLRKADFELDDVDFEAIGGFDELDDAVAAIDEVSLEECDVAASGSDPEIASGGDEPAGMVVGGGGSDRHSSGDEAAVLEAAEVALEGFFLATSAGDLETAESFATGAFLLESRHQALVEETVRREPPELAVELDLTGVEPLGGGTFEIEGEMSLLVDGEARDITHLVVEFDGQDAVIADFSTRGLPPISDRLLGQPGEPFESEGFTSQVVSAKLAGIDDPGLEVVVELLGEPPIEGAQIPDGAELFYIDSFAEQKTTTMWAFSPPSANAPPRVVAFLPGEFDDLDLGVSLFLPFRGSSGEEVEAMVVVPPVP